MPGHNYVRVGRYADAVLANQRAVAMDSAYLAQMTMPYGPTNARNAAETSTIEKGIHTVAS